MKKVIFIFSIALLFVAFPFSAFSQAMCPIITLKVNKVRGNIVYKDGKTEPIPDIKLELRKPDDEETLVSTATTNESGLFEFKDIQKGAYILIVDFVINGKSWLEYRTVVKVKKSNSSKSKPSILIRFAIDCFETEAVTIN